MRKLLHGLNFDPTRTLVKVEGSRGCCLVLGGRGSERVTDFVCSMYDSHDMAACAEP